MAKYANIIVDISHEKLDKTFQYKVPEAMREKLSEGMQVYIPFGSRKIKGYVIELTDEPEYDVAKMKEIAGILPESVPIESRLIALAGWMKRNYGGTMNHALRTVLPVRKKSGAVEKKTVRLLLGGSEVKNLLAEFRRRHAVARERLLAALMECGEMEKSLITQKLNVSGEVIRAFESMGIVAVKSERAYRNPVARLAGAGSTPPLNAAQQAAVDAVWDDYEAGRRGTYLLKGVTGSGKTEVYMELISRMLGEGRQAIVLIPEIALTYQTVMRFCSRFGDRVSILNSRLSQGERFDQLERAKNGEVQIMIGPRSALFTPFPDLGLIVVDEEHEGSYKSETVPRYHARETAVARAKMCGAVVVLGSATPSVDSYYRAKRGEYRLLELNSRVEEKPLPSVELVDMRKELFAGNRSILSGRLQELMEGRLDAGEQTMLFLNRRGVSGFVSCRACGHVIKCPHCDVSLSEHAAPGQKGAYLACHYCGYTAKMPVVCPSCGSKYIGGFKAGTQKIEMVVKKRFPKARVLRMDTDTTRDKEGYERILSAFANREADILIGTQMIVKGHDFPNVTLVGVLAADLSLHVGDYRAAERTFELLTQAAGRAGRGEKPGVALIQTYRPEHYSIQAACAHDYGAFYEQEIAYRGLMRYPPVWNLLVVLCASENEPAAQNAASALAGRIRDGAKKTDGEILCIGPADAAVAKVNDVYKKLVYVKAEKYETLVAIKDGLERFLRERPVFGGVTVQFDFNPVNGF